jgi:hypothetical protein
MSRPDPDESAARPFGAHDVELRAALKRHLATRTATDARVVVDELGLAFGAVRADVAVIGEVLEGFEIKAGRDTLARLSRQVQAYDQVFERCWVVTVQAHQGRVLGLLPSWWGLLVADGSGGLRAVRTPQRSPMQDAAHVVRLLWRAEALALLESLGLSRGLKGRPKLALFAKLADSVALADLTRYVSGCLRARTSWRDEQGRSILGKDLPAV